MILPDVNVLVHAFRSDSSLATTIFVEIGWMESSTATRATAPLCKC